MICTRSKLEGGNNVVVVLQFVDLRGEGVGRGEHLHLDTIQDFLCKLGMKPCYRKS